MCELERKTYRCTWGSLTLDDLLGGTEVKYIFWGGAQQLIKVCALSTSPHMWLADGDSLMCYIVRMLRLIA